MIALDSEDEKIVGVLHDVVEDSKWTFDILRAEGFSERIIEALESVTKLEGEGYDAFIERARRNPLGRKVKIADLTDNMDMRRIGEPTDKDFERLKKYYRALSFLQ